MSIDICFTRWTLSRSIDAHSFRLMDSSGAKNASRLGESVSMKKELEAIEPHADSVLGNLHQGLVVIMDENVCNGWLRERVVRAYPAVEGQVRKVVIETYSTVSQRGSNKSSAARRTRL